MKHPRPRSIAPWPELRLWLVVSAVVSASLLIGTLVAAHFLPASSSSGGHSFQLGTYSTAPDTPWIYNLRFVLMRNVIVLLLHYFCCMVGVIVAHEYTPLPDKWARYSRFHRPLPKWLGDAALAYAFSVTLTSVAVQSVDIGFTLADIGAYTGLAHWQIILATLPHAIPELIGIFLPLGLFLVQSVRHDLTLLRRYINQTLVIGLCLILCAGLIEVWLNPHIFEWMIDAHKASK